MDGDPLDIDAWFAERGYRLDVHEIDVTGMERIREGPEPPIYEITLIGKGGHLHRPGYASGDALDEIKVQARDRQLRELTEPLRAALR